jgi:Ser/Thr protein kinase RdoA (MazF antagonist)
MEWLHTLSRDTGLGVPTPIPTRSGDWVIEISNAGVPEPRCCMVFSWLPGRDLSRQLTQANVRKFGRLSAQMHQFAENFRPPAHFEILRFDTLFPFPEPVLLFEPAYAHLFPPGRREVFELGIAQAQSALDRLKASGEAMRVLHGDLHHWNVHVYRGRLYPFDFEDLMWGWPVQDLATTLYYWADRDDYASLVSDFKAGYLSAAPWPERTPGEIDAFIALRGIGLANFILQDPNPDWQAETPAFIAHTEKLVQRLLSLA